MAKGEQTKSYIATVAWHLSAQARRGYGTETAKGLLESNLPPSAG